jgi:CrcB protein
MARYVMDFQVQTRFGRVTPIGTMSVNLVGSVILGFVSGLVAHHGLSPSVRNVVGVGFCGGLTTFSTASFETVRLFRDGFARAGLATAVGGMTLSCVGAAIGLGLALA